MSTPATPRFSLWSIYMHYMCLCVRLTSHSAEANDWTQKHAWLILRAVVCPVPKHTHAWGTCIWNTKIYTSNWSVQISLRETFTSQPPVVHKSSNMWAASCPPTCSILSPLLSYLNEHPRHRDGIAHFWHFSAKSSMGAKIKLSERAELSGRPPALPVRQTAGTLCAPVLLAWAKSKASRQSAG